LILIQLNACILNNEHRKSIHHTSMDNAMILQLIYDNNMEKLSELDLKNINMNFLAEHPPTDLDDRITPLAAASFLGRYEIVESILENPFVNIDMITEETGLTPLSSACAAGHFMIVKMLVENGADVNKTTGLNFSPLYYCFTRMTESISIYENKNLCCKIAEVLLRAGADVDYKKNGKTLLMKFARAKYDMTQIQKLMNMEVIRFLIEHGADKSLVTKSKC